MDETEPSAAESLGGSVAQGMARAAGRAIGKAAGKALKAGAKAAGKWILSLGAPILGLLALVFVMMVLIAAVLHGPGNHVTNGPTQKSEEQAATQAIDDSIRVMSFDGREMDFAPPTDLVAAITWDLYNAKSTVTVRQVAEGLAPHFTYSTGQGAIYTENASATSTGVGVGHEMNNPIQMIVQAVNYQGTATLTYTAGTPHSVSCPAAWNTTPGTTCVSTTPKLASVSWSYWPSGQSPLLPYLTKWFPGNSAQDMLQLVVLQSQQWAGEDWEQIGLPVPASGSLTKNVSQWASIFAEYATPTVPAQLLEAVTAQESQGDPNALSKTGAEGLMQIEPGTTPGVSDLFDPQANVQAGSTFLNWLAGLYGLRAGCVPLVATNASCQQALALVLAGYYAGPGAVAKAGQAVPSDALGYVRKVEGYLADFA